MHGAQHYEIRIQGQWGSEWSSWFDGLQLRPDENGDTVLTGPPLDQAALYGILKKIRDLGAPLLSVVCLNAPKKGT